MSQLDYSWYAVSIAQGGLTFRHTKMEITSRHKNRGLRWCGPLGFPAEEILKRRGYEVFIPVESIFIRKNRYRVIEKQRVRRALIPGLAFIKLAEPVMCWYDLLNVPMVTGVFGLHGIPRRFQDHEMGRLIAMSEDLRQPEYYKPMPTRKGYKVGDKVRDLGARFDMPLEVIEITGQTAKVLGKLFGADYEMTAHVSNLAKWA